MGACSSIQSGSAGGSEEERSGNGGGNPFPPGRDDDSLASLLPSAAELGLSMAEERPNARKCVAQPPQLQQLPEISLPLLARGNPCL